MITPIEILIAEELAKVQITGADLIPAAQRQIERIQARTASGVDYEGNPWPPYAPHSKEKGTVTLGDLAESIEMETDPQGITLAIAGQKGQIADYQNNGTSRLPRRHFFDVSAADMEAIQVDVVEQIMSRLTR
jgi:hypothetical protein